MVAYHRLRKRQKRRDSKQLRHAPLTFSFARNKALLKERKGPLEAPPNQASAAVLRQYEGKRTAKHGDDHADPQGNDGLNYAIPGVTAQRSERTTGPDAGTLREHAGPDGGRGAARAIRSCTLSPTALRAIPSVGWRWEGTPRRRALADDPPQTRWQNRDDSNRRVTCLSRRRPMMSMFWGWAGSHPGGQAIHLALGPFPF